MFNSASSHEALSGHSMNVSGKSHFKGSGQHMHPLWCYSLTDDAPQHATVSSPPGARWQSSISLSKTVYSFLVKEDTPPGQKEQQHLFQHIPLPHINITLLCPRVARSMCGKSGHSVRDSHAYQVLGAGGWWGELVPPEPPLRGVLIIPQPGFWSTKLVHTHCDGAAGGFPGI